MIQISFYKKLETALIQKILNFKIVIFGSNEADDMQITIAKNFNFLDSVDIDCVPDWLVTELTGLNHFKKCVKNGIHYIGADGKR